MQDTLEYVSRLRRTTRINWIHRVHFDSMHNVFRTLSRLYRQTVLSLAFRRICSSLTEICCSLEDLWGTSPQCMYFSCRRFYSSTCPSILCVKEASCVTSAEEGHLHYTLINGSDCQLLLTRMYSAVGRVDEWRASVVTNLRDLTWPRPGARYTSRHQSLGVRTTYLDGAHAIRCSSMLTLGIMVTLIVAPSRVLFASEMSSKR